MTFSGFAYFVQPAELSANLLLLSGCHLIWQGAAFRVNSVYWLIRWRKSVQDELTLLHRARALDPDALAQIHDTYYASIYRYIVLRVSDHQTAEDLTSEVFTRLLHALQDKTAPSNTIRGWLFSVASRAVKDYYRGYYRQEKTNVDHLAPDEPAAPEQVLEQKISQEALLTAVTDLTEEQRK
jgi:RNA polymerase sigma-70 factor (ECF subfamily)